MLYGADNEIFIDQSGATSNLDIEQVGGSGNIIGGATAAAGSMTALDIDGATMTLDILQKVQQTNFLVIYGQIPIQVIFHLLVIPTLLICLQMRLTLQELMVLM